MPTPSLFIKSATFSDTTTIEFNDNDIVIFVGPNNAGKSVALKNLKEKSVKRSNAGLVIKDVSLSSYGSREELIEWLANNFRKNPENPDNPHFSGLGAGVHMQSAINWWINNSNGLYDLAHFFVYLLTTDARLSAANPAPIIALTKEPLNHPIHYMQVDDGIELKMSKYFKQAFGDELVVHRNAGNLVPLHCGKRPIPQVGQDRVSMDYIRSVEALPTLHTQGDGMRAFIGVILHSLIVKHTVVLIDEPEAFLHPPQARLLGRMLIDEAPTDRQLFIATHSGDFLRGLLDAESERVRIIRLQRDGNTNIVAELNNDGIRSLWADPLLRYSNILDGLFHNRVVVCESDSDSRFYAAITDALFDSDVEGVRQDIMFVNCGGKTRLAIVIKALKNLKVPVSAIADFDILNSDEPLKTIFSSLGGDWTEIESDYRLVKTSIEQKKPELDTEEVIKQIQEVLSRISESNFPKEAKEGIQRILRRSSPWSVAKEVGKAFVPSGDPTLACNKLFEEFRAKRLFIVEVGELEGFARSIGGHGPKWVNTVLAKNLAEDHELENARVFVKAVVG